MTKQHKNIPIFEPVFAGNEKKYLIEAIDTGWISSQGPFITRFEADFAAYHGVAHAVACSNCTTALHMALLAAGVGPGDEVLCPDLTFISPANMIKLCGAEAVLVDIENQGFNIDPALLEVKITTRTKAVIVVHQFGHAADMDAICTIAKKHNLVVIEDVAEAVGARYKGRMLGTIGDMACYSMYGNKIITTGEGGAVITNNPKIDRDLRVLRDHGMTPGKKYHHEILGFNYRLTNLQAAVGLGQLERLDEILALRQKIAAHYERRLSNASGLRWRPQLSYSQSVFWLATITLQKPEWRDPFMRHLKDNCIEPRPMIFPVHFAPYFGYAPDTNEFPVATTISLRSVHLPSSTSLTTDDIDRICDVVLEWTRRQ
jgi:perosamine synthetase